MIDTDKDPKFFHRNDLNVDLNSTFAHVKYDSDSKISYKKILKFKPNEQSKPHVNEYFDHLKHFQKINSLNQVTQKLAFPDQSKTNKEYFNLVRSRNIDEFKIITKDSPEDPQDCMGMTAMHWAAKRGYNEFISYLLAKSYDTSKVDI